MTPPGPGPRETLGSALLGRGLPARPSPGSRTCRLARGAQRGVAFAGGVFQPGRVAQQHLAMRGLDQPAPAPRGRWNDSSTMPTMAAWKGAASRRSRAGRLTWWIDRSAGMRVRPRVGRARSATCAPPRPLPPHRPAAGLARSGRWREHDPDLHRLAVADETDTNLVADAALFQNGAHLIHVRDLFAIERDDDVAQLDPPPR